jgi:Chromo (CHRromatin Organisation MOdifier) domain
MTTFVKNYVEGCAMCQQMKVNTHPTMLPLQPIKSTATRPFALVTTDFITDLPENDGSDSIMVVVDHGLTKGVIFIPCSKMVDVLGSANLYLQHVYMHFGLPDKIISDRDPHFASKLYQELGKLLRVKLAMSTAYHPQTDGETEHVNQELEIYLWMLCSNNPETWKQYLATMEFAHNQKFHSLVKNTPFFLMMGSNPQAMPLAYPKTNVPAAKQRISQLLRAREEALATHELTRQMMAAWMTNKFHPFKKGDRVWLDSRNLKIGYPTRKLAPKCEGPFLIEKVLSTHSYQLKLPHQWQIHPVFHATLLTPYKETETHGANHLMPPPDLIEGELEHEVEAIVAHKRQGSHYKYLIKWQGYPTAENTWEPKSNLKHSPDLLTTYKLRKKL